MQKSYNNRWLKTGWVEYMHTYINFRASFLQKDLSANTSYCHLSRKNTCIHEHTYLENGDMDVRPTRPPFFMPLSRSTRPPFQYFSVPQDPLFNQKSQNFRIFLKKYLNLAVFHVPTPENWLKSSSESLNLDQKSVLKVSNLSKKNQFNKPLFG